MREAACYRTYKKHRFRQGCDLYADVACLIAAFVDRASTAGLLRTLLKLGLIGGKGSQFVSLADARTQPAAKHSCFRQRVRRTTVREAVEKFTAVSIARGGRGIYARWG